MNNVDKAKKWLKDDLRVKWAPAVPVLAFAAFLDAEKPVCGVLSYGETGTYHCQNPNPCPIHEKPVVKECEQYPDEHGVIQRRLMNQIIDNQQLATKPLFKPQPECEHVSITKLPTCNACGAIVYKPQPERKEIEHLKMPYEFGTAQIPNKIAEIIDHLNNLK